MSLFICAAALCFLAGCSRHYFYMLQLNSYYNDRYFSWWRKTRRIQLWRIAAAVALLLPLTPLLQGMTAIFLIAAGVGMWVRPAAEKKPFVITDRIKRQLMACGLLLLVLGAVALPLGRLLTGLCNGWLRRYGIGGIIPTYAGQLAAALVVLFPPRLLPPLCNATLAGVERRIAQRFIDSAIGKLRGMADLTVIGVTGSYGKTSVKYILAEMLKERYNTLITPESYNTTMGVVRTVNEQLRPQHQVFLCEMGARHPGDIKEICDIVHPQYGIITAVGIAHLESFGTTERILRTKFELTDSLPDTGTVFLNVDSEPVRDADYQRPHVTYGLTSSASCYATEITYDARGTSFTLHLSMWENPIRVSTKLLGRHNVLNIVGAASLAATMGITPQQMAVSLKRLHPVPHRLQLKNNGHVLVIDDAYNSNPEGAAEAVAVLGSMPGRTRIMVTPGMVELGDRQWQANHDFGTLAAQHCDYVIAVGANAQALTEGLRNGGLDTAHCKTASGLREALAMLPPLMQGPSALLLENDLTDDLEW